MIVKDESDVIEKCLNSVKPIIDYWVIVDTGSTDDTKEVIQKCMRGIPGELHERSWVDFAHNRNEALQLAKGKGDYLFFIDADEVLQYAKDFTLPFLNCDVYYIDMRQIDAADFKRIGLVKNGLDWKWSGALHEVITASQAQQYSSLKGVINLCNTGQGARAKDPQRRIKDAKILEMALEQEPTNARHAYYIGISYLAAKEHESAESYFRKRVEMPSQDVQETYCAIYYLGVAQEKLGKTEAALQSFFQAFAYRPTRAEPLFQIATLYRKMGNYLLGYLVAKHALEIPYPAHDLCVEYIVYDYALLIEFSNCALLLQKYNEGLGASSILLANPELPDQFREQVASNCKFAREKLQTTRGE